MASQIENDALFRDIAAYLQKEAAKKVTYQSIATGFVTALGHGDILTAVREYQQGNNTGELLAMLGNVSNLVIIPDLDSLIATALTGEPLSVHQGGRTVITSFIIKPTGQDEMNPTAIIGAAGFSRIPVIAGNGSGLQAFVHAEDTNIVARVSAIPFKGLRIQAVREARSF